MFILGYIRKCCQQIAGSLVISGIDVLIDDLVTAEAAETTAVTIEVGPAVVVATEIDVSVEAGEDVEIND